MWAIVYFTLVSSVWASKLSSTLSGVILVSGENGSANMIGIGNSRHTATMPQKECYSTLENVNRHAYLFLVDDASWANPLHISSKCLDCFNLLLSHIVRHNDCYRYREYRTGLHRACGRHTGIVSSMHR